MTTRGSHLNVKSQFRGGQTTAALLLIMRSSKTGCSFGCVARSAVLLKPNVANILLFNFCEQKFVQNGLITIAIDCTGISLLILEEKWPNYACGQISAPNSDSFFVRRLFNVCVQWGFSVPQMRQFCLFTYPPRSKWTSSEKMIFFFCQNRHLLYFEGKRFGWSIGFNSWTNWSLYGVIPIMSPKCSIVENDGELMLMALHSYTFCHISNILGSTHCF